MSPLQAKSQAKRILVVDDVEDNLFLLQTILTEEGFEVDVAKNGKSALAKIEATPPDIVLMDAMMPGMNGYETTRRIRQNKNLPFMPILLITAYLDANAAQGLELGANDFIRKPIEYDELMARIKSSLRLKEMMNSNQ
ncbi:response regulator [Allocoleopsis franciscana]|uniref:Response regulator with CheY-like receiver domain and winged-helix DNA-binding domain n=1 Tax=Allocoleopsis franciscana PCC 7113 TaxID=1173027 RepID=K9WM16_9CYAN|nr:response regulator [Allocoleopsis franciscana]AFZ21455.1 response regulator with CheY-like receiver domain and winged-helix DNA-binding domain [Allocoleopsis franciscana PCC 7113]